MRDAQPTQGCGAEARVTDDDDPVMVPMSRADLDAVSHLHPCGPLISGLRCERCLRVQTFVAEAHALLHAPAPAAGTPMAMALETRAPAAPRARLAKG